MCVQGDPHSIVQYGLLLHLQLTETVMFSSCLSDREALIASYADAVIVQYVHVRFTHGLPNHPKVTEQERSYLPSLPGQLRHSVCDVLETLSEPRSPPLRCQALPLQSASFVELLLVEVALDLVPCL